MAKKTATFGEYIVSVEDNGSIRVCKIYDNVKNSLRECAETRDFKYNPEWTTRQFGAKLIKEFGSDNMAEIGEYTIVQRDNGSIETFRIYDNTKGALREIAEKIGLEYDPEWTTRQFGAKLSKYMDETSLITEQVKESANVNTQRIRSGNPFQKWLNIESNFESAIVKSIEGYADFFSVNKFVGCLSFLLLVEIVLLASVFLAPVYYIAKLAVRVVMIVKKEYVVTPDNKKGTLIPVLNRIWKEYNDWSSSHKFWGLLGYIYLWFFIASILFYLAVCYIPYTIIRGVFDSVVKDSK